MTDEYTIRSNLAHAQACLTTLSRAVEETEQAIHQLRAALGALLLPHLPVGTQIERVQRRGRPQQYRITHHEPRGFGNETAVAWIVPLNRDGTVRDRGGRWLDDWRRYRVVALPPDHEEAQAQPTPPRERGSHKIPLRCIHAVP